MTKYRIKSNEIEAIKFTRNNIEEVIEFTNGKATCFIIEKSINGRASCRLKCFDKSIRVLENRYIVKLANGDFYICDEESFESLYERIDG